MEGELLSQVSKNLKTTDLRGHRTMHGIFVDPIKIPVLSEANTNFHPGLRTHVLVATPLTTEDKLLT